MEKHSKNLASLIADIDFAWKKCDGDKMHETLARWCLGVRLVNNQIPPAWWNDFYVRLFTKTGGRTVLAHERKIIFLTANLTVFKAACKGLSIDIPEFVDRQRRDPLLIGKGYQYDHKEPFADFGEGYVEPIPALLNAAKGARQEKGAPAACDRAEAGLRTDLPTPSNP